MSVKRGEQLDTIPRMPDDLFQVSLNLDKADQFVKSLAVTWEHYKAIPSPIGLKDRGGFRREQLDTTSSNGMIFAKAGEFSGTMLGNSSNKQDTDSGQYDNAVCRLVLPRFYDSNKERIYLCVGDRLFLKDIEALVSTYQLAERNPNSEFDSLQYPIKCVETLIDSVGKKYVAGYDFEITNDGRLHWIKSAPGIDESTGKGMVYSIRYLYKAHWYVQSLPNEVRVTQVTNDEGTRKPERMPYHAVIVREYVYHNKVNDEQNTNESCPRKEDQPIEKIDVGAPVVRVNLDDME